MKLSYVDLCGFRGYRNRLRIDFASGFTIIDGRNGVGKSTVFDAVEFALTGTLSKYDGAKADRESVLDYLWWTGKGPSPKDRYVEVGFSGDNGECSLRRTQFQKPDAASLQKITAQLCDLSMAPEDPLTRLCSRAIIRDEQIASLSLDLKEVERYTLLRDGLGASDADTWIDRAQALVAATKKRSISAKSEVDRINSEVAQAARRIDEIRAALTSDSAIDDAARRLQTFAKSSLAPDQLLGPVREAIADTQFLIQSLESLVSSWEAAVRERMRLPSLVEAFDRASAELAVAEERLRVMESVIGGAPLYSELAEKARDLIKLAELGRRLDLQNGNCPLCASSQDHDHFVRGVALAEELAKNLDAQAALVAQQEQFRLEAAERFAIAEKAKAEAGTLLASSELAIQQFEKARSELGFTADDNVDHVRAKIAQVRSQLDEVQKDLRVLGTLRLSGELDRAQKDESHAKERLAAAQERAGLARRAEVSAQSLHDAARRAASETLDRRLDQVLPLMSELYRRLRPHPVWRDIEYSIRGDVRRFLKLQVGDNLNPQFLFSSGQRRATGLAFLLSVNLSLAWSRFGTIMLDDPVQHVDDFRTIHLAELAAQLVAGGRQIICSVEDAALADLLCRRLPVSEYGSGKRISLGSDDNGDLSIINEQKLSPMSPNVLATQPAIASVG